MTKVFDDTSLKPTRKLIMLAIADNANDTGVAFPSWNTLVKKTGLSRQGLQDNLKALEADGYLFKKNRSRKKGGRSSNKYVIYPHQNKDILDEEDYLLFEDLYSQSQSDVPSSQSQSDVLGSDSQSQSDVLESEPSLKSKPSLSEFDKFINYLKEKAKYKSKVTKTKDGEKLFKQIEDKKQLVIDYLTHQEEKQDFAVRITKYMEDYQTVYKQQKKTNDKFGGWSE